MAKPKSKPRQKTQKLSINGIRRGELRYDTQYNATDAARSATKLARQGYQVTVQPWRSTGSRNIAMTCEPVVAKRGSKTVAVCKMTPAFKKQLKLRP